MHLSAARLRSPVRDAPACRLHVRPDPAQCGSIQPPAAPY